MVICQKIKISQVLLGLIWDKWINAANGSLAVQPTDGIGFVFYEGAQLQGHLGSHVFFLLFFS